MANEKQVINEKLMSMLSLFFSEQSERGFCLDEIESLKG